MIVVGRGEGALALLDGRWDALLARQPRPNPLLCATWLRALARWGTGTPLTVVEESRGGYAAGIALEVRRIHGLATAGWLGPPVQLLSPDALGDPEAAARVLGAALHETGFLSLDVTPAAGVAAQALRLAAPWHEERTAGERWVLDWPSQRLGHLRGKVDKDVHRAERRGAAVETRVLSSEEDVARAVVRLFRLHRRRWDGRPDLLPRLASTHALRTWNAAVLRALAREGKVRIAEVHEDGVLVASNLVLLHGAGGMGHTQAMHAGRGLESPGYLALLEALGALAEAHATRIDLASGGTSQKERLGGRPEPLVRLVSARTQRRQRPVRAVYALRRRAVARA